MMDVRRNIELKQDALRQLLASQVEWAIQVKHVDAWVVRSPNQCRSDAMISEATLHAIETAIDEVSRAFAKGADEPTVLALVSRSGMGSLPHELQYVADRFVGDSWWCPWYNTVFIRNATSESVGEVLCRQLVVSLLWNDSTGTRFPAAVVEGEAVWRSELMARQSDADLLAWSRGIIARRKHVDISDLFAVSYEDAAGRSELGVWGNTDFMARAALAVGLLHRLAVQSDQPMPALVEEVTAGRRSATISDTYRAFCRWRAV